MKITLSVAVAGPVDAHATAQSLQDISGLPASVVFQGMQPHVSYVWCGSAGPSRLPADLMLCLSGMNVIPPTAAAATATKAPAPAKATYNAIAVRHIARYADAVIVVAGGGPEDCDDDGRHDQPVDEAWLRPYIFAARAAHAKCVVALLRDGTKKDAAAAMTDAFERVCRAAGYVFGENAFVLTTGAPIVVDKGDVVADFVLRLRGDVAANAADSALLQRLRACLIERIHEKTRLSQPHYSLPTALDEEGSSAGEEDKKVSCRTIPIPTRASFIHRYRQGLAAALLYVVQGRLRVGDVLASPALETSLANNNARIASLHAFPHTARAVPLTEAGAGEYVTVTLEGSGPDDSGFFAGMDSGTLLGAAGPAARAAGLLRPPEMPFEVQVRVRDGHVQGSSDKKGLSTSTPMVLESTERNEVPNAMLSSCSHIITRDLDIQQPLWAARRPDPEDPAAAYRLLFSEAPAQLLCSLDDDTGAIYDYETALNTESKGIFGPQRFGLLVTSDGSGGMPSFSLVKLVVRSRRLDALRCAAAVVAAMPNAPLQSPRWHRSDHRVKKTWQATIIDPIARGACALTSASLALVAAAPTSLLADLGIVVARPGKRVPATKLSPIGILTGFGGTAGEELAVEAMGLVFDDVCMPIMNATTTHEGNNAGFSMIPFSTLYRSAAPCGLMTPRLPQPLSRKTILITRSYYGDTKHRPAYPAEALRDSTGGGGPLPDVYCRIIEAIQDNLYLAERDTVCDWRQRPEDRTIPERNFQRAIYTAFDLPCPSSAFDKNRQPSRGCATMGTSRCLADRYYLNVTPRHVRLAKILLDHFEVPRCPGLILDTLMRRYALGTRATDATSRPDDSDAVSPAMNAFLLLLAQRFRSLTLLHLPTLAPFLTFVDQCPETVRILSSTNLLCDIWHTVQQRWARLSPEERHCPKRLAALASPFLSLFAADCCGDGPPSPQGTRGKSPSTAKMSLIGWSNMEGNNTMEPASELSLSSLLEAFKSAVPEAPASRFPLDVVVRHWAAVGVGNRKDSLDCSLSAVASGYLLRHALHVRGRAAPPAVIRCIASFL